ncbi:MAG: galactose-1-phosphate uridylyltransferase [Nitrosarchaeum sp.]|nr:galactose-1-phosphate uridylyltransferase [Nitrosarchaeum sp.]
MAELRKDYILDQYVIIAQERAKRPSQFSRSPPTPSSDKDCPLCPHNEHMIPGVLEQVGDGRGGWLMRAIPNKFAAVGQEGSAALSTHDPLFVHGLALGEHEVIIDTPHHDMEFEDLSVEHIERLLQFYAHRARVVESKPHVRYTALFKNRGEEAGASISHSHAQIIGLSVFPPAVARLFDRAYDYALRNESCPFCDVIRREKHSKRLIFINKTFVCIAPFASRFPFEAWILPLRHVPAMDKLRKEEFSDFAHMLRKVLRRLGTLGVPPYNLVFYNDERQGMFHFHVQVLPRLAKWAGFEHEVSVPINPVPPESASSFYREG